MEKYARSESSSQTAWPIHRAGYPFILAAGFTTLVLALLGFKTAALVALLITICICCFFRDPQRAVTSEDKAVVSPADGKVIVAGRIDSNPYDEGAALKVSIFMSVFNVHVNRAPHEGQVEKIEYTPGKFSPASTQEAGERNEKNAIFVRTQNGVRLCMVQVAGLVARRIICIVGKGQKLRRGQRVGLISFGSRVDLYLPLETSLTVAKGDKVKAGTSILGYLQ